MVVCLEQGADLHTAQLTPLPLTVSCFSKIQIGFTFLVPAHLGSPGKGPLNESVCVCALILLVGWQEGHPACKKTEQWGAGSWCHYHSLSLASVKSKLVFTVLVPAHPGSPGQRTVKWVWCVYFFSYISATMKYCNDCISHAPHPSGSGPRGSLLAALCCWG